MPKSLERGLFRVAIVALGVAVVLLAQRELSRGEAESEVLGVQTEAGSLVAGAEGRQAAAAGAVAESDERFSVLEPRADTTVSSWKIEVVGVGPANTAVSSGATSVTVDDEGTWVMPVILFRGENELEFQNGSTGATVTTKLTYKPEGEGPGADAEAEDEPPVPTTAAPVSSGAERASAPPTTAKPVSANSGAIESKANPKSGAKKGQTPKGQSGANRPTPSANPTATSSNTPRVAISRTQVVSETSGSSSSAPTSKSKKPDESSTAEPRTRTGARR